MQGERIGESLEESPIITSKLKIFNKNYKGLGTTEKEKKQEETQTGR